MAPETGCTGGSEARSLTFYSPPVPPQAWSSAASSSRRTSMASASPSAATASSWCSPCGQVRFPQRREEILG